MPLTQLIARIIAFVLIFSIHTSGLQLLIFPARFCINILILSADFLIQPKCLDTLPLPPRGFPIPSVVVIQDPEDLRWAILDLSALI